MELRTDSTSKCLDRKLTMLGFEVPDLLLIFLTISILNFLFGKTDFKLLLVWLPSVTLALTLKLGKRGKPDDFLIHYTKFYFKQKHYSAFTDPSDWKTPPKRKN